MLIVRQLMLAMMGGGRVGYVRVLGWKEASEVVVELR
jgi:hypothetical protein